MANVEEPRRALFQASAHARTDAAADFLSIQRVEMQSRLPLLLVVRQQRERHDGTDGEEVHRLAPWIGQSVASPYGRRTTAPAKVHSQDCLLRFKERLHRVSPDEWPAHETGRDRSVGGCGSGCSESCRGLS